ncbi:hypothetical protein EYC80_005745 [Monilinia laxa]|uniref:Uncharacterized protein n=1 Tax=Monilinia laxa TaxID=61186 RepID=A0A5N6KG90_MONLA|nr:hypothetical protein EYC80_005745 [Monilinia laxa]
MNITYHWNNLLGYLSGKRNQLQVNRQVQLSKIPESAFKSFVRPFPLFNPIVPEFPVTSSHDVFANLHIMIPTNNHQDSLLCPRHLCDFVCDCSGSGLMCFIRLGFQCLRCVRELADSQGWVNERGS